MNQAIMCPTRGGSVAAKFLTVDLIRGSGGKSH